MTSGSGGGMSLLFSFPWEVSVRYGSGSGLLAFADGEWWRVITAMFLHGGLVHFGFNSMALLSLGPIMESEYGTERFWVVYLASGIVGNLAHMATSGPGVVGASGALCGLIGLLIAFGTRVRTQATAHLKSAMIRFAFIMVVISLIPGVSWKAHFGGFACGYLLGWIVPNGQFRSKAQATFWQLVSLAGVILVLYCFYEISVHGADVFERYGI
ncbi:hypothetical protein ABI59_22755 [Acidobacteria bacterium Mor1]|nr:hypothetical protein ABI59_22755 [Acidobacteria bacterium Mor1]